MEENISTSQVYISMSKKNIDSFMRNNEYRKAFGLLIAVLKRLDENEKNEFINYYSNKYFSTMH
jgi:hypothetical protein